MKILAYCHRKLAATLGRQMFRKIPNVRKTKTNAVRRTVRNRGTYQGCRADTQTVERDLMRPYLPLFYGKQLYFSFPIL